MKKEKPIKRPYATRYFTGVNDTESSYTSHGAASSDTGAIRASVVRIFMGEYAKAVIYDRREGIAIYTVKLGAHGLQVHYGNAVGSGKLRRVK